MQRTVSRLPVIAALSLIALASGGASAHAAGNATPRIIAGSNVPISQVPFQVRVEIEQPPDTFECGGSIRDASHVITAAHCVTTENQPHIKAAASEVTVFYGSANTGNQTPASVSQVAVPSQYTALLNPDESYDGALLTLSTPLNLSGPNAKAIPLAALSQPKESGDAFVSGWGLTNPSGHTTPDNLKGVSVPLRTNSSCSSVYGSAYVASRAVCAGGGSAPSGNPDTCQGDSGGPLAVDTDPSAARHYVLLGLTSFGNSCGTNDPAVYTYTRGAGLSSFLLARGGSTAPRNTGSGGQHVGAGFVTADRVKPLARVSKIHCKRRRCAFRVRASDKGGSVRKLSARVTRRVRTCAKAQGKRRRCKTRTRTRHLKPHRIRGGFRMTAKLHVGRYKLSAVATDKSGNRSKTATKRFRVRHR